MGLLSGSAYTYSGYYRRFGSTSRLSRLLSPSVFSSSFLLSGRNFKEARLPDCGSIKPDDENVEIVLKLGDDLHLNEIDCVRLLRSLLGRDPYGNFAPCSCTLAVVLDQGLEADLWADIERYLEDLITAGLGQQFISLIKVMVTGNDPIIEGFVDCISRKILVITLKGKKLQIPTTRISFKELKLKGSGNDTVNLFNVFSLSVR
ncbi:hypothetical protein ACH5RR_024482 [Cinchona calisaya]|uniref:Uncharacterized protein n=1 Tax=Cinchona calisaya TaxID=153742 RepID=A0ABD2Z0E1_9GENT